MCELTGIGLSTGINEFKAHPELLEYKLIQELAYILIPCDVIFLKVIIVMSDRVHISSFIVLTWCVPKTIYLPISKFSKATSCLITKHSLLKNSLFIEVKIWLSFPTTDYSFFYIDNGEGNGNPLQYSCLENPMEGGAWQAKVHEVVKSQRRLSNFYFYIEKLKSNI